jgi:hypothetical protein
LEGENNRVTPDLQVSRLGPQRDRPEEMFEDGVVRIFLILELKAPVGCMRKDQMQDALDCLKRKVVEPRRESSIRDQKAINKSEKD